MKKETLLKLLEILSGDIAKLCMKDVRNLKSDFIIEKLRELEGESSDAVRELCETLKEELERRGYFEIKKEEVTLNIRAKICTSSTKAKLKKGMSVNHLKELRHLVLAGYYGAKRQGKEFPKEMQDIAFLIEEEIEKVENESI